MNGAVLRMAGYFVGFVATDIIVGLWEAHKMRREFREYVNDNGGEVRAHIVTEETAGTVTVVGGSAYDAAPGDVLFATERGDVFDVGNGDALDGYTDVTESREDTEGDQGDEETEDEEPAYDPSAYTVPEVTQYLSNATPAEVERVLSAEREGKNRQGVVNYAAE